MITLTANAAQKVKGILEQEKESLPQGGLRIYVQGAAAPASSTAWCSTRSPRATRCSSSKGEGHRGPDEPAPPRGAEVDYKEDLMGGGFAIKNPNAKSTCGCGHSFQAGEGEGGPQH